MMNLNDRYLSIFMVFTYGCCTASIISSDHVKPQGLSATAGVSVLVGLRAVRDLLSDATRIPSASPTRQFVKSGGYERAVKDFYSTHPSFVHSFELPSHTYVTAGRAGDRQLILRHSGMKNKPTLEITQMTPIPSYPAYRQSISPKITDEITYVD